MKNKKPQIAAAITVAALILVGVAATTKSGPDVYDEGKVSGTLEVAAECGRMAASGYANVETMSFVVRDMDGKFLAEMKPLTILDSGRPSSAHPFGYCDFTYWSDEDIPKLDRYSIESPRGDFTVTEDEIQTFEGAYDTFYRLFELSLG